MRIKPMLGSFELIGIEYIESSERRALAEHRVPGLAGNYLQDLGTMPNRITVAGTRHGDEARDTFLTGIRELFNSGEPTTFVADINTATELVDVVIEDLQVAEVGGTTSSFRYEFTLRKYIKPPEPPAAGLPTVNSGVLEQAQNLLGALDTLDALGSIPDLSDPTPPLRGALDGVRVATTGIEEATNNLRDLVG